MQIISQTAPGVETTFEEDYIYNFLLADVKSIQSDRNVIVYSSNRREKKTQDAKPNDIIVHLSNENLRYNYRFLHNDNVVLRSYYHPFLWKKTCYAIPLGWQTGFANSNKRVGGHNKYMWCFIGQIKGYRKPMYEAFKNTYPNYTSISDKWNSNTISDLDVQHIYLDSAFALVPFGSIHADTMRIMEVLEWGCIPVVIDYLRGDYYKYIYGDHPFVIAKNWNDARKKVLAIWNDKIALKTKQKEVFDWYIQYKIDLKADITDILNGRKPMRCKQWKYQKCGRFNLKMLLIWYYHFYFKKRYIY